MNQNRLFQSKFMANQALGEVIAHSGSLGEGLDAAEKNPLIMGFGADAFANARTAQGIQLQAAEAKQKLGTSGYEAALQAGIQAMNDPINYGKYFDNGMKLVDPVVQDRVRPQVEAVKEMIGQKIKGLDLTDPGQLKTAQDRIKAAIIGSYTGAGGDPSHLAPFLPSVDVSQEGIAVRKPSPQEILQGGTPAPITPRPVAPQGGATGGKPVITNPSTGEDIPVDTSSAQNYMKGRSIYNGIPVLNDNARQADAHLQEEHAGPELEQYRGANNVIANLTQMDSDIAELGQHGGLTTPGFLGVARGELAKAIQTFTAATGLELPESMKNLPTDVADVETINKYQHVLTFMAKKAFEGTGARGLGVLMEASSAVPGMENTPLGFMVISAGLKATANWQARKYEFKEKWAQDRNNTGGSLVGSEMAFNKAYSPLQATQEELSKVGVEIGPNKKIRFTSDDQLLHAYDNGLLGKPGSKEALAAFDSMYKDVDHKGQ